MSSAKDADPSLGYLTRKDTEVKLPRPTRVKNKTPAPIQITAEQILREARERQEAEIRPPKQKITDSTELADYRLRKRKEFEDLIRRVRWNISVWIKYAQWEESQKDFNRARSVWERALEVDYRNHTLWLKYAEVEMKNKFINHARNVWDRAVTLLPRVDQLWYKYIHMEEMLGNVAGARQIFERWMSWMPDQQGWLSYIKFELRYNEIERARGIFERFVQCHPKVSAWIRYAKFEMKNGEVERARNSLRRGARRQSVLGVSTSLHWTIYPKGAEDLYRKFVSFEKQLEESVGSKERIREVYERAIANVPPAEEKRYWQRYIYLWINYALYEELDAEDMERTRDVYSSVVWCLEYRPFSMIYLGMFVSDLWEGANYAANIDSLFLGKIDVFVILGVLWMDATWISVRGYLDWRRCKEMGMHKPNSSQEVFICKDMAFSAAQFEIRQLNLTGARQILGNAIGKAPKDKIFKKYIEIELQLGNIDRCRKLYEKYLEWSPENCYAWSKYAELERSLSETERARSIFELAIAQPALDMPELLWKAYIDFEISEGEYDRTRHLYERLLDRTKHLKVWISYAEFEASAMEEVVEGADSLEEQKRKCIQNARRVFEKAINYFRTSAPELKEERAMLLEEWLNMESSFGELGDVGLVQPKLPKKLKKRRPITSEDGLAGMEEFTDYVFPEETQAPNLKILEAAYRWKKQKISTED
ncbi:hypothetical protein GH714_005388 [Hevea brasiliensis]|uniref:Pre-mRNA-splicing factor Syf1-like N-terminal HAT-repeats domain-containing protein n=1 Tax=Hevea brasiliensis TaxID=3981 RepID=A0A6A6LD25_HEVBR|nr:hypothetical protein GH714_005388 [Hevea brasiliensis]